MKNKKIILLYLFIVLSIVKVVSGNIKGHLIDKEGRPVPDLTIVQLDAATNRLLKTCLSDKKGEFQLLENDKPTVVYLSGIGYKTRKINIKKGQSNLDIMVVPRSGQKIAEVTVKKERNNVVIKQDRLVYNMSTNPLKDDNTMEALKYVPLIVANGESFSIAGKSVTQVYINGRKSRLSGLALNNYLKSLPAKNIRNIEIMTAPNSSFRGEGDFGVLNIILKKDQSMEGLNGSFNISTRKTHYFKENGGIDLNYQKDKLRVNLSVGGNNGSTWNKNDFTSVYKKRANKTVNNTMTDAKDRAYFAGIIADYQIDKKQTLGFVFNNDLTYEKDNQRGNTTYGNLGFEKKDSLLSLDYFSKIKACNLAANINYRVLFNHPNQYLNIDFDYINQHNASNHTNSTDKLNPANGDFISIDRDFKEDSPQKSDVWSGKIEYNQDFAHDFSLDAGIDSYHSDMDNDDKFLVNSGAGYVNDLTQSNHFVEKEWTSALFFSLNKQWNKQLSSELGSRFEYTRYSGQQLTTNTHFDNHYFKCLPSFYTNYAINANHSLSYNLVFRIQRPSFRAFNPFRVYQTPTSYSVGNPYLKPSKLIIQELRYVLLNRFYFTATYTQTKDVIFGGQIVKPNMEIENTPLNLGTYNVFAFRFGANKSYCDGRGYFNANLSYNWMREKGQASGLSMNYLNQYFNANLNNNFKLSKKHRWSVDLGLNYYTPQVYSNWYSPASLYCSFQLKKQIRNMQFSLYYYGNTYFYEGKVSQIGKRSYDTNDLHTVSYSKGEENSIGVRFSILFGNTKIKEVKHRQTSSSGVKSRL